jgi:hypothetical protein
MKVILTMGRQGSCPLALSGVWLGRTQPRAGRPAGLVTGAQC